jgi:hypothetical protein
MEHVLRAEICHGASKCDARVEVHRQGSGKDREVRYSARLRQEVQDMGVRQRTC